MSGSSWAARVLALGQVGLAIAACSDAQPLAESRDAVHSHADRTPREDAPVDDVATVSDGGRDARAEQDAHAAAATACGSTVCRGGESCVAGACEFVACAGVAVPGDFPTVQHALDAMKTSGGTICLSAQHYPEHATHVAATKPIKIIGISAAKSSLSSFAASDVPMVVLRGIRLEKFARFDGAVHLEIVAADIGDGSAEALSIASSVRSSHAVIRATRVRGSPGLRVFHERSLTFEGDGLDIAGTANAACAEVRHTSTSALNASGTLAFSLVNSYLHDCKEGFASANASGAAAGTIRVTNDTITSTQTGVSLELVGYAHELKNNLFVSNGVAISATGNASLDASNNLLFANAVDYVGVAAAGPQASASDPKLTTDVPPRPSPGSPAIGAGLANAGPRHDYWRKLRGDRIDVGAVQAP